MQPDPVLDDPALGAALLSCQHLRTRTRMGVEELTAHLVGLQAQNPWSPYTALWSRLEGFTPADLAHDLLERRVARLVTVRGTIHLVTAQDALLLPAVMGPTLRRELQTNATHGPALREVDLDDLADAARDLVEDEPMTPPALGAALARRWPQIPPAALAHGARGLLPLVQVTPRGVWGHSAGTTWTTTRAWLGKEPADLTDPEARRDALEHLTLRYLGAFGPASVADLQYWSGLTGLREVVTGLRSRLVVHRGVPTPAGRPGRQLVDLPSAARPGPARTDPPRFLPDFDNLTIGHADRRRVVTDDHRRRLVRPNGVTPGKVLVSGMVRATWSLHRTTSRDRSTPSGATLVVDPLEHLEPAAIDAVVDEGGRLVDLLAPDAADRTVEVRPVQEVRPPPARHRP